MTGDTWDPEKLEGVRQLIDIYHYLGSQGVVGRWVHVYRPLVTGDEPAMYFERLSQDGKRGILIPRRLAPDPVTIKPKGLNAGESYVVSFQESKASETRTGSDLMEHGITIERMEPGELIYLNLPYHPGNSLDKVPPKPPGSARKALASDMGYPGVELTWTAGQDDHWISYYEVLRNNTVVDKVAKGVFYFDHSAGADIAANYQVRTVDGAGNRSGLVTAQGPGAKPAAYPGRRSRRYFVFRKLAAGDRISSLPTREQSAIATRKAQASPFRSRGQSSPGSQNWAMIAARPRS